jgi:hypothetical protein
MLVRMNMAVFLILLSSPNPEPRVRLGRMLQGSTAA